MIRTTPVEVGTIPYDWNSKYMWQCVWYVYYRCIENSLPAPCWFEGSGSHGYGAYTDAKMWIENYRSPWIPFSVKDYPDYTPRANDIVVYDGQYGHVQFMETDTMYSEYSNGNPNSFKNGTYERKGNLLGFLHYPNEVLNPVARNVNVNQIQTTDTALRIRVVPSLNAEIVGYVQIGYYNVLETKEADGYTWYKLADDRWCANVTTIYLPSDEEDIIKQIEEYFNSMKTKVTEVTKENTKLKDDMKKIDNIARRWT